VTSESTRSLPHSIMERTADGLVAVRYRPDAAADTAQDAYAMKAALVELIGDAKTAIVVIPGSGQPPSRGFMRAMRSLSDGQAVAVGIVVTSRVNMLAGNLFVRLMRTTWPVRLFVSEDEARAWLVERLRG